MRGEGERGRGMGRQVTEMELQEWLRQVGEGREREVGEGDLGEARLHGQRGETRRRRLQEGGGNSDGQQQQQPQESSSPQSGETSEPAAEPRSDGGSDGGSVELIHVGEHHSWQYAVLIMLCTLNGCEGTGPQGRALLPVAAYHSAFQLPGQLVALPLVLSYCQNLFVQV